MIKYLIAFFIIISTAHAQYSPPRPEYFHRFEERTIERAKEAVEQEIFWSANIRFRDIRVVSKNYVVGQVSWKGLNNRYTKWKNFTYKYGRVTIRNN